MDVQNDRTPHGVPGLFRNTISLIGTALAIVAFANIAFLFLIDVTSGRPSPYIGMFAYVIMPSFLVFGLLLIPVGMLLERNRRRKLAPGDIPKYPRLDLNDPKQRSRIAGVAAFLVVFVMLSAIGSYHAYEFSDTTQFCGQLCHKVMNPEYTAYLQSPHARVACVDCHVGAGATWYVKSKLSGAYQIYAATFNKYPKPIPSPVENLRPAQETCEQCHWPRKFHGSQFKVITHFGSDEKNTPRQIRMLVKTGGGDPSVGVASGIHWHMNIANKVEYIATDPKRQNIPYVRVEDQQGHVTEYVSKDSKLTPEQIAAAPKRRMDCVDCHNRPTHIYVPPDRSVDEALLAKRLDVTMPFMKQQAVTALTTEYKTPDEAMKGIDRSLSDFYKAKPEVDNARVQSAVKEVQRIYNNTIFPEMKVDWRVHNNNIGHFYYPGCFRCHDENHVSKDGKKTVTKDCNVCHTLLGQEEGPGAPAGTVLATEFKHPVDIGDLKSVSCSDCHNGGVGP
jgi:nitrate/TMAO reductase-like tetraheme cytochrome c subunit